MSDFFLFTKGPQGRGVRVDDQGRLLTTSDTGAGSFIFTYGDTGRPLVVDASGRMVVNMGLFAGEGSSLPASGSVSPDLESSNNFYIPIEEDMTISMGVDRSNVSKYLFVIRQSASGGGKTITFTNTLWAEMTPPVLTAPSGSIDVCALTYIPQLNQYLGDFRANWG
jgi:hypothetical protein